MRFRQWVVLPMLVLASATVTARVADTIQHDTVKGKTQIAFSLGNARVRIDYAGNKTELTQLGSTLRTILDDPSLTLLQLHVASYGSPDGPSGVNKRLVAHRTDSVTAYLTQQMGVPASLISVSQTPEDWQGLQELVEQSTVRQLPHRDALLAIISGNRLPEDKEWLLKSLYPDDFRYLLKHCMPPLRRAVIDIVYRQEQQPDAPQEPVAVVTPDTTALQPADTMEAIPVDVPNQQRSLLLALRTNLLYDVALVPNIGIEIPLGRQWSVAADWFGTWLSSDRKHNYWQGYGGYLTVRRYLGTPSARKPLGGHHVGVYGLGMTYDVEFGGRGYQAEKFGFGGGVEYGYAMSIGRHWLLDFTLGVGFQDGEYKEYLPMDGHYVWQSTHKRHWWGPTKAEVSLKWLIGKKGGAR